MLIMQHPFRVSYNEFVGTPIDGPLGSLPAVISTHCYGLALLEIVRCVVHVCLSNNWRLIPFPVEI
jgi:hypothetical protein